MRDTWPLLGNRHDRKEHGRHARSHRSGHRRFHRRAGDRGFGQTRRPGREGSGPRHAGIGQGHHGSARAVCRHRARGKVKENDTVSQGRVIALIETDEKTASKPAQAERPAVPAGDENVPKKPSSAEAAGSPAAAQAAPARKSEQQEQRGDESGPRSPPIPFDADAIAPDKVPYASPAVRAFARELGVDLARVHGSARNGRITKEDVQAFVKSALAGGGAPQATAASGSGSLDLLPWPQVDFSKYGEIEEKSLSRIKKLSGANLARNWVMIPHVTQHEL